MTLDSFLKGGWGEVSAFVAIVAVLVYVLGKQSADNAATFPPLVSNQGPPAQNLTSGFWTTPAIPYTYNLPGVSVSNLPNNTGSGCACSGTMSSAFVDSLNSLEQQYTNAIANIDQNYLANIQAALPDINLLTLAPAGSA